MEFVQLLVVDIKQYWFGIQTNIALHPDQYRFDIRTHIALLSFLYWRLLRQSPVLYLEC